MYTERFIFCVVHLFLVCRLQNSLLNGVAEPLTQFKASLDASIEEVNKFNLMVSRICALLCFLIIVMLFSKHQ